MSISSRMRNLESVAAKHRERHAVRDRFAAFMGEFADAAPAHREALESAVVFARDAGRDVTNLRGVLTWHPADPEAHRATAALRSLLGAYMMASGRRSPDSKVIRFRPPPLRPGEEPPDPVIFLNMGES